MNGVLPIIKPAGFTSFDAVAVMRGISHQKKIGHTGTLDPLATGVLPLLLGSATKAASLLPETDKIYDAGFVLGFSTDTLDCTGKVTKTTDEKITEEALLAVLPAFTGNLLQVPPMYSAVSVNGKRLYDLARQGKEIERAPRPIFVKDLRLLEFDCAAQKGTLHVECSKGTYVRSLVDDIAAAAGTLGTLQSLCRSAACGFTLQDCLTLEQAKALGAENRLESALAPVESLFAAFPAVTVSAAQAVRFSNGGELDLLRLEQTAAQILAENDLCRVYEPRGAFLGLGKADLSAGCLRVEKLFAARPTA